MWYRPAFGEALCRFKWLCAAPFTNLDNLWFACDRNSARSRARVVDAPPMGRETLHHRGGAVDPQAADLATPERCAGSASRRRLALAEVPEACNSPPSRDDVDNSPRQADLAAAAVNDEFAAEPSGWAGWKAVEAISQYVLRVGSEVHDLHFISGERLRHAVTHR